MTTPSPSYKPAEGPDGVRIQCEMSDDANPCWGEVDQRFEYVQGEDWSRDGWLCEGHRDFVIGPSEYETEAEHAETMAQIKAMDAAAAERKRTAAAEQAARDAKADAWFKRNAIVAKPAHETGEE